MVKTYQKEVVFYGLPDWRYSGRPVDDILITIGTNQVKCDAFIEVVESDTPGAVTTADVIKASAQVWAQIRRAALAELEATRKALRAPKL